MISIGDYRSPLKEPPFSESESTIQSWSMDWSKKHEQVSQFTLAVSDRPRLPSGDNATVRWCCCSRSYCMRFYFFLLCHPGSEYCLNKVCIDSQLGQQQMGSRRSEQARGKVNWSIMHRFFGGINDTITCAITRSLKTHAQASDIYGQWCSDY